MHMTPLLAMRHASGMTLKQISGALGCSHQAISAFESGRADLRAELVKKYAKLGSLGALAVAGGCVALYAFLAWGSSPTPTGGIDSVHAMIAEVQKYVPGYRLKNGPVFDGKRVSIYLEVEGLGDYLPNYAGNLDIMTAAALRTAEMFAEEILDGSLQLTAVNA